VETVQSVRVARLLETPVRLAPLPVNDVAAMLPALSNVAKVPLLSGSVMVRSVFVLGVESVTTPVPDAFGVRAILLIILSPDL
jgi:hypothetical protein